MLGPKKLNAPGARVSFSSFSLRNIGVASTWYWKRPTPVQYSSLLSIDAVLKMDGELACDVSDLEWLWIELLIDSVSELDDELAFDISNSALLCFFIDNAIVWDSGSGSSRVEDGRGPVRRFFGENSQPCPMLTNDGSIYSLGLLLAV